VEATVVGGPLYRGGIFLDEEKLFNYMYTYFSAHCVKTMYDISSSELMKMVVIW